MSTALQQLQTLALAHVILLVQVPCLSLLMASPTSQAELTAAALVCVLATTQNSQMAVLLTLQVPDCTLLTLFYRL